MSERPSDGIGKRLARYRRLAGLSARELSDKLGGEMSRGVIANIESGKKKDVTVDQLVFLAWALGIPPILLALPVEQPFKFVRVLDGEGQREVVRAHVLNTWFLNDQGGRLSEPVEIEETAAGALGQELLYRVREYPKLLRDVQAAQGAAPEAEDTRVRELELTYAERFLKQLGVDTTTFSVDE